MGRVISNDVVYPFIPGTQRDRLLAIKDCIIYTYGPSEGVLSIGQAQSQFVCLHSIKVSGGLCDVSYVFRSYFSVGGGNYEYRSISFDVNAGRGYSSVRSLDGYSVLVVDSDSLYVPTSDEIMPTAGIIVEPCCVRWFVTYLKSVSMVNEQRLVKPEDRISLTNTVLKVFDKDSPLDLRDGYNVEISTTDNSLNIMGSPGAGEGMAPDNMWEDQAPPPSDKEVIMTINGQRPDDSGNLSIDSSDSVIVSIGEVDNTITIEST